MESDEFFTFGEYMKKEGRTLSASLEDYLEMIWRLSEDAGYARIHDLAVALNVQPPSTTKAVQKLAELGMVNYKKYGIIIMHDKGKEIGAALLKRHNIIEEFLRLVGIEEEQILQETEKIEHTISNQTLQKFEMLIDFFKHRPAALDDLRLYQQLKG